MAQQGLPLFQNPSSTSYRFFSQCRFEVVNFENDSVAIPMIDESYFRVRTEPGDLAFSELPGFLDNFVSQLLLGEPILQKSGGFGVAHSGERSRAGARSEKLLGFLDDASLEHLICAVRDRLI